MQTEIPHMQIKPEDLRKIQLKSLEMLLYFKEICDKNGLLFYFCGGCCIGALRNKGFIDVYKRQARAGRADEAAGKLHTLADARIFAWGLQFAPAGNHALQFLHPF